ncbi:hypothetical protein SAZ11_58920 [Streptomyces sp. FXJ1.4098]|nr:hypothetical protein [Streptomyces sp. FXJ1.4098]
MGGGPHDYDPPGALDVLPEIRRLVFADEWGAAQRLADSSFMGVPSEQRRTSRWAICGWRFRVRGSTRTTAGSWTSPRRSRR